MVRMVLIFVQRSTSIPNKQHSFGFQSKEEEDENKTKKYKIFTHVLIFEWIHTTLKEKKNIGTNSK